MKRLDTWDVSTLRGISDKELIVKKSYISFVIKFYDHSEIIGMKSLNQVENRGILHNQLINN